MRVRSGRQLVARVPPPALLPVRRRDGTPPPGGRNMETLHEPGSGPGVSPVRTETETHRRDARATTVALRPPSVHGPNARPKLEAEALPDPRGGDGSSPSWFTVATSDAEMLETFHGSSIRGESGGASPLSLQQGKQLLSETRPVIRKSQAHISRQRKPRESCPATVKIKLAQSVAPVCARL